MPDTYVIRADVEGLVPPHIVLKALDDDADGEEDTGTWDKIVTVVTKTINGYIEARYALPLDPIPSLVSGCALPLFCEALYDRCGFSNEDNPWSSRARAARDTLASVSRGEIGLGPEHGHPHEAPGSVSEPSRMASGGRLMI